MAKQIYNHKTGMLHIPTKVVYTFWTKLLKNLSLTSESVKLS